MGTSRMHTALAVLAEHFLHLGIRFDRMGRWSPERVAVALILLVSQPHLTSVEKLMPELSRIFGWSSVPSDSTFIEARQKFAKRFPTAMWDLWQGALVRLVELVPVSHRTMCERQWVAVDGTWAWAPHTAGNIARWGQPKAKDGKCLHFPQMLLVTALDVLTRAPLAVVALAHNGSERAGLRAFLDRFTPKMVVMVDRGFPAQDLLVSLVARGADILWRMGTAECNAWACVTNFLNDPAKPMEAVVDLPFGPKDAQNRPTTIKVRLIRRTFGPGRPKKGQTRQKMVLMTTLIDATTWPADELIAQYARRWVIEDWFRDIKVRFSLESFHSRSDTLIIQEIHALMTWATICAIIERTAIQRVDQSRGPQDPADPYRYQISQSNLYQVAARMFAHVLKLRDIDAVMAESERDLQWLDSTARRRRPNRSYIRERKGVHGRWNG